MIVIIPLGGVGERFKQNGYKKPKALIKILGKPILYYLLENLNIENVDFICIPYNKEYSEYNFEQQLKKDFPNINFLFHKLSNDTEGAAETINMALKTFTFQDKPVLCLDGDNFYTIDIIKIWNGENRIITFEDINNNPIYSYIKIEQQYVLDIIEKEKISNFACTGAYGFKSYKQLLKYTQQIIDNKIKQKNEYYTSTVIKEMLKDDIKFQYSVINNEIYHCLGTPFQVKLFYNQFSKKDNKSLRFCFDLDNTLVSFPTVKDDYTTVEPIHKNIQFLRYLKEMNHTIIIYTARRMKTHNGNIGKIIADVGKITLDTLERFTIPFDEIYFGKPNADIYIDDLALNCFDNMEKELGFYFDTIEPRDFNTLEKNVMNIITKKSKDLSGEIYYYKNIPNTIKELFPLFITNGHDYTWYKIEEITGLVVSNIYLSELLKEDILIDIMNCIHRIHTTSFENEEEKEENIYENYSNKLRERYQKYDYSKFPNSEKKYNKLLDELTIYETKQNGKKSVIHGDSVFSNILIDNFGKIKFIDMRGKLGDVLTICGDEMYDWAKLYQSLVGYDSILLDKYINREYFEKMKKVFEDFFLEKYTIEDFENLKTITKSLLFTLIPLHDNIKCYKYYELIDTF